MPRRRCAIFIATLCCACAADEPEAAPDQGRPPPNRVFIDELGEYVEDPVAWVARGEPLFFPEPGTAHEDKLTCWVPDADSQDSVGPLDGACAADGIVTGPGASSGELFPSRYCRRAGCAEPSEEPSGESVMPY